jgi:iron complex outermembrane receptor protein
MGGLTLSGSYTYAYVRIPATINPFPVYVAGVGMVVNTTPINIYQEYTPTDAVTGAIDYQTPFEHFTLRAHLDGNWNSGSYGTDRDPSTTLKAIKSQPGLVFNGRISVGDIELSSGARLTVSLWARNLFNEQHVYTRSISLTTGITGVFNDPTTFGVEGKVKF